MKKKIRYCFIIAAAMIMIFASACGEEESENKNEAVPATVQTQETAEKQDRSADEVRQELIGEWGRLGEVMHEFYDDGGCVIGGMYGSYEVGDDLTLIMTTQGGTVTDYKWAEPTAENYWRLEGDMLTVNGSTFTKVTE